MKWLIGILVLIAAIGIGFGFCGVLGVFEDDEEDQPGYEDGYDQAMKDVMKHAEELQFRSDDFGYAYGCGYEKAMQDFMEKAKKWIEYEWSNSSVANLMFGSFKNYMQNELMVDDWVLWKGKSVQVASAS